MYIHTCELQLITIVATMTNILIISDTYILLNKETVRSKINIPRRGTRAKCSDGSMHTSRHTTLLKVADHSRCRKVFVVQSHERPLGIRPLLVTGKKTK